MKQEVERQMLLERQRAEELDAVYKFAKYRAFMRSFYLGHS